MAKSTTYKGQPKPFGKPGHFDEPMRHSLQAKGIKTGNMSGSSIYEGLGIQNLEKPTPVIVDTTPKTSTGLEDVEKETIQEKEEQPKKSTFGEKFWGAEKKVEGSIKELQESIKREKELKAKLRKERLYNELGKKEPELEVEPDEDTDDEDTEEYDSESMPNKLGHFLANVSDDYTAEDMVGLNDKELELLAIRFKTENKESISPFGEPSNPFLEELKNRIQAKDELRKEKAKIREELKHPQKEKGLFEDLFEDMF